MVAAKATATTIARGRGNNDSNRDCLDNGGGCLNDGDSNGGGNR